MTIQTTIQIAPSCEEIASIQRIESLLRAVHAYFGEDATLINSETGEVVEINELPRVLGILSAFAESNNWEIRKG
jgi:hypothetical protein